MGQILLPENIGALTKFSTTQVQLSSSVLNIGGQQYRTSILNLLTGTIGIGGLDAAIQNWKLYYVYAVLSGGVVSLVASINNTSVGPTGFSTFRLVGYFDSDGTPMILSSASSLIGSVGDYKTAHMTEAQFQAQNGPGWILSDGRSVTGSAWAAFQGATTVPDARGLVIRGKSGGNGQNPDGDVALGTYQGDTMQGHRHDIPAYLAFGTGQPYSVPGGGNIGPFYGTGNPNNDGSNGTPRTSVETRMKNITANHFIKVN